MQSYRAVAVLFVAVFACAAPSPTHAQSRPRVIARLGAEMGGEKVLQFTYDDGSTPDVPAGAGILLSGGAAWEAYASRAGALDLQGTIGVKYRTIPPASNQDATWLRFPLEALAFYRLPSGFRIGGGATAHFANSLKASGAVLNDRIDFKTSPGFIVQAEYVMKNVAFDARYTGLTYEVSSGGSGSVDASSFGLGASYFFGRSVPRGK